jgi:hypothetical protein
MAQPRVGGNQRWLLPTLVLLVLVPIGIAVANAVANKDGGRPDLRRSGSKQIADDDEKPALGFEGKAPQTYEITYGIERYDQDRIQESVETITVRRPFDSRIVTKIDGKEVGRRVSRYGALVLNTGQGPRSLAAPPAPASGDLHLATSLPEAVERGWAELREQRRVAGQTCQVYRVGSTIAAGELVPNGRKKGEWADVCVDRKGLLLEEVWTKDDHALQRRVATKRRLDLRVTDADFEFKGETALTIDEGNGFIKDVDPQSAWEGTVYRIPEAPEGFTYRGRVVVQPPKLSPFRNPLDDGPRTEQVSLVDSWSRGPDLLVFSQTIAAAITAIPNDAKTARPLDLGPFGDAATVLDLRSNEVRIELPEDRFIRIAGSLRTEELIEIARSMRAENGTGLVFTGEERR